MYTEETDVVVEDKEQQRWCIDIGWLDEHGRSIMALAYGSLCHRCQRRFGAQGGDVTLPEFMKNIRECCSKEEGFITSDLPILESAFRLFLSSGNVPLDVTELGSQLSERRGIDTYRTSYEILSRLLAHDDYYGLQPVQE